MGYKKHIIHYYIIIQLYYWVVLSIARFNSEVGKHTSPVLTILVIVPGPPQALAMQCGYIVCVTWNRLSARLVDMVLQTKLRP